MPSEITVAGATTELEAINKMLRAAAIAPITDLTAAQDQTDVLQATSELRDATREVQTLPWKFNTRFQVQLAPVTTESLADTDGTLQSLNIFTPPASLMSFEASNTVAQMKRGMPLDLAIQPSITYSPGTLVFFDRRFNREGLIAADFPYLYIDATYAWDFLKLPQSARRYIAVLAGRRFIQAVIGSTEVAGFQQQDEAIALRALVRDQGQPDQFNMLANPDVSRVLGFRPRITAPIADTRRGR